MDQYCSKLVSSSLDKHTSLDKQTSLSKETHLLTIESVNYESEMFLQYIHQGANVIKLLISVIYRFS